jgi:hypothetical protein
MTEQTGDGQGVVGDAQYTHGAEPPRKASYGQDKMQREAP